MRIGVTGAYSYVGRHIIEYLQGKNHTIHAFDVDKGGQTVTRFTRFDLRDGLTPGQVEDVDALIHLAYDFTPLTWEDVKEVNVDGGETVFSAAEKAGVEHLVYISSLSAFPGTKSRYGRAKHALEDIAFEYGAAVIRPGLVYGEEMGSVMGGLQRLVSLTPVVPVPMGGPYTHYFCHYTDLAEAVELFCTGQEDIPDEAVVAASENGVPFREMLNRLAAAADTWAWFLPVPTRLAYAGLRSLEYLGIDIGLRSDSVLGLVHTNENPDFSRTRELSVAFRDFTVDTIGTVQ